MKLKGGEIISLLLVIVSFGTGLYFYPRFPELMASHWNAQGQADGYMGKFWGTFLTPVIMLGLWLLLLVVPRIDPLKTNINEFRGYYEGFMILMTAFMLYLYLLTIAWNQGLKFDFTRLLLPAFAVIIYYMGVLLGRAKRNYSIGIRTPWTLASERVWDKTHRLGAVLFKGSAIVTLFGVIVPDYAFILFMGSLLGVSLFVVVYSYYEFQKDSGVG